MLSFEYIIVFPHTPLTSQICTIQVSSSLVVYAKIFDSYAIKNKLKIIFQLIFMNTIYLFFSQIFIKYTII